MILEEVVTFAVIALGMVVSVLVIATSLPQRRKTRRQKKSTKEEKAMKELEELQKSVAPPVNLPTINPPPPPAFNSLVEVPIGSRVQIEITSADEQKHQRIVIKKGIFSIRPGILPTDIFMFVWRIKGMPRSYYVNPKKIIRVPVQGRRGKPREVLKLVYDILYADPLTQQGEVDWSPELETIWRDSGADQYITAVSLEGRFEFTRVMIYGMIVAFAFLFPLGLSLDASFHIVPTTIIHWVP